jgi:hypothetical protein
MNATSITNIKKVSICLITGMLKPQPAINHSPTIEINTENMAAGKTNSLAYLAYKNRQDKGLISNEKDGSPVILFGDEWVF